MQGCKLIYSDGWDLHGKEQQKEKISFQVTDYHAGFCWAFQTIDSDVISSLGCALCHTRLRQAT